MRLRTFLLLLVTFVLPAFAAEAGDGKRAAFYEGPQLFVMTGIHRQHHQRHVGRRLHRRGRMDAREATGEAGRVEQRPG